MRLSVTLLRVLHTRGPYYYGGRVPFSARLVKSSFLHHVPFTNVSRHFFHWLEHLYGHRLYMSTVLEFAPVCQYSCSLLTSSSWGNFLTVLCLSTAYWRNVSSRLFGRLLHKCSWVHDVSICIFFACAVFCHLNLGLRWWVECTELVVNSLWFININKFHIATCRHALDLKKWCIRHR